MPSETPSGNHASDNHASDNHPLEKHVLQDRPHSPLTHSEMPIPSVRHAASGRWSGPWLRQAALNVGLVCLAASAVCGKQLLLRFSLFAVGGSCPSPVVTNVKLTDLYMTGTGTGLKTFKIEWDGDPNAGQFINGAPPAAGTLTVDTVHKHFTVLYTMAAQSGTSYPFAIQQVEPPPQNYTYGCTSYTLSLAVTINVTPVQAAVVDNQTVDARYDPRYALWTYLNHNFGSTINGQYVTNVYRGGLYVGYNSDKSEVGHSYLNFTLPAVPAGQHLWVGVGSVNAYYLRSYAPGSTVIACQSVATTWAGSTVTWATAPAFTPGNATAIQQATVSYSGTAPNQVPNSGWTHWNMGADIGTALSGSLAYSAALGGFSEPSTASAPISGAATGWVYFSKKECPAGQPAAILYAYGSPT